MRLIGVDVGGTFTDLVYADTDAGRTAVHKVSTTPDDPARGVVEGLMALCDKYGIPRETIDVVPGSFVVHPPGELHEYINGPQRTLLFRVRYGNDMLTRHMENRQHADWAQKPEDAAFFRANPALATAEVA